MADAWKAILALAVFALPLAYCEAEAAKAREDRAAREIEACARSGGVWTNGWREYCARD